MAYKSWSKRLLKKQIMQTKQIGAIEDSEILKELLYNSIHPFDPEVYSNTDDFNRKLLNEYSYYLKYIKELANLPKQNVDYPSLIQIPTSSQLTFVHDLFQEVTPKWMDIFNKIYSERKRNLRIGIDGSYSVYLASIDYSYITSNRENLIDDLFNLVHEYTHAIVDRIYFRNDYISGYPFIELPSLNMELIASLFMPIVYADIEYDVNFYLKYLLYLIKEYAMNITSIDNRLTLNADNPNTSNFEHSLIHDISYVIPFMYVVQMFYLYQEDKEKWFDTLDKIIKLPNSNNYLNNIKKLGLTPNKCMDKLLSDLNIS